MKDPKDITILLRQWHEGDHEAGEELFRLIMPELLRIAARLRSRERQNYPLQRTELVNEIYTRLLAANLAIDWRDRGHFFAIFTIKLRHFLVEQARRKPIPELLSIEKLPEGLLAGKSQLEVRLAVDQLLEEMEQELPVVCSIVVARMYFGYEIQEIAEKVSLPQRTVERHLHNGRRWLFERLKKIDAK